MEEVVASVALQQYNMENVRFFQELLNVAKDKK